LSKQLKDSGDREQFKTGAVRDLQIGKGRMDLLPMRALVELSKHFEAGCNKYGERNWELGVPLHTFVNSGLRHLAQFMCGEYDEPHLTAVCWNFMCLLDRIIYLRENEVTVPINTLPIDLSTCCLHHETP
jgi:hypothetical protein